jgi:PAS domain S-box-containing protein
VLLRLSQMRRARDAGREQAHRDARARSDAVEQSEARFRTLIEEAPVAVAILRRGQFIYTNRRYNLLHGYADGQQLNGLPWRAMIAPQSLAELTEQEAAIGADAPLEQQFEALGLGNGASLVPVYKNTIRVVLADGPATLIFVQDISAQKRAERFLLEARDAAEAANRSKAEFLANMSHEIRTPLNAILGLAYLMEQATLSAEARAMLLKIRMSGKSLLGIINDILDVSKIDAGEMKIDNAWFDPQQVLDNLAATMGVAVGEKDIALLVHPLPEGVGRLFGDALRLEQLLVNLASNAIKFTERGRVELGVSVVARQSDRLTLRFCVADTGIGIAPHLQAAIFAPFTQADSSTTRRFGGSGLGLTICKKLVTLLGGEIGLDSTPGAGSQFWFTLDFPCAAAPVSSPEMTGLHALIVHEDAPSLASIASTARALGWQVSTAASNEAVMRLLTAAPQVLPDVLLLHRAAHDVSTLPMAAAIRACMPPARCPVVILTTTFELTALANTPEAALIDAFLTKPVTASTLYNTVIAARHRRGAIQASPASQPRGGASLDGIRLLVVDDSEINRDVAQRILCSEGAQVTLANDGQSAIDYLLAHGSEVDLVLMDVQMPVLDGIAAARHLRTLAQFDDLPIVALTAGAFQSEHDAARAAGMTDFITKPFDIPHTTALIRRLRRAPRATPSMAIDMAHGIALWGELDTFSQYLDKFARDYGNAMPALRAGLDPAEAAAGAALAHKLAGSAANVALPEVARTALAAERALASGAGAPQACLARLEAALERALHDIAQLAPAAAATTQVAPHPTREELASLIDDLLAALHGDNPAPALPLLSRLAGAVPPGACEDIGHALERFDFRRAERATRALATRLAQTTERTP